MRKKKFAVLFFLTGSSLCAFFYKWLISDFKSSFDQFKLYALIYITLSALLTWVYMYLKEPLRNKRVFNLIEICLKTIGILFFCLGVSYLELSASILTGYSIINLSYAFSENLPNMPLIPEIKYSCFSFILMIYYSCFYNQMYLGIDIFRPRENFYL